MTILRSTSSASKTEVLHTNHWDFGRRVTKSKGKNDNGNACNWQQLWLRLQNSTLVMRTTWSVICLAVHLNRTAALFQGSTAVSEVRNLSSLRPVTRMGAGNVAFLISLHTEVLLHAHTPKHAQAFFPVSVTGTWELWFQMSKKSVAQHRGCAEEKHGPDFISTWQLRDHSNATKWRKKSIEILNQRSKGSPGKR